MEPVEEREKEVGNSSGRTEGEEAARASGDDDDDVIEIDPREWVRGAMSEGLSPRQILLSLLGPDCPLAQDVSEAALWRLLISLLTTPDPRPRLTQYNSVADAVQLISTARSIVVLTGAGISVSCGIPDFRSPQGLYATLHREFPELPDPQAMFDIHYFNDDSRPFFRFCKEIYPGQFTPSPSHRFIAALEQHSQLLRHYTQNIDTLEHAAGITRVVYCHGSFATASCCRCKHRVDCDAIREDIMKQEVPMCQKCMEDEGDDDDDEEERPGVMKPDIVFFGEGLPEEFHHTLEEDKTKADLLIVMGSSLKVRPVSLIPSVLDESVPQILINRESLPHMTFDIQLLGYSDTIVGELCRRLGAEWVESVGGASDVGAVVFSSPEEHTHLFPGAVWRRDDCSEAPDTDDHTHTVNSEPKTSAQNSTSEPNDHTHTVNSEPKTSAQNSTSEPNGHTHMVNSEPNGHPPSGTSANNHLTTSSPDHTPSSEATHSTSTLTSEHNGHSQFNNYQPDDHTPVPNNTNGAPLQTKPSTDLATSSPKKSTGSPTLPENDVPSAKRPRMIHDL